MNNTTQATPTGVIGRVIAIGKDLVALLRDSTLFILTLMLIVFPSTFNSILVSAGFEEGSFVGLKWKSNLEVTNESLDLANETISNLQAKNDELIDALEQAQKKLEAASNVSNRDQFEQTLGKLKEENVSLRTASDIVQTSVSKRLQSNLNFIEKKDRTAPLSKANYLVGIQTLAVNDEKRLQLNAEVKSQGYGLSDVSKNYSISQRPAWFAHRSTVFYYSVSAREQATQLALLLREKTGESFQVERGAGLGVNEAYRDVTLYVHFLSQ